MAERAIDFAVEEWKKKWRRVPLEVAASPNVLHWSKESDLHKRLAGIGAVVSHVPDNPMAKCLDLIFGLDSEESFSGLGSD
ncbi:hypothetical protein IscW_ISCW018734 [Ixodes scapularis]|uniref:Uncharacterized protein n=1 Tax=Ixodes scapularis TaxID=6945 RepID=B7PP56_IXOSC|nr:hypothetical protein IscW_ISCW018734 [Ixodes scapularis]|eukprot:XP_002435548.1 hypothetical protein IscW_ISCW018734 [Ixodes scapularis]